MFHFPKHRLFSVLTLFAALSLASCGNAEKRTDGTAGEAVVGQEEAAAQGGVQADATVIDNEAGATVTADADSVEELDND
ncbi:hypothetical protein SAMN00120144_2679 [Hymenobacter roseosalivarius DSM 11622]|uniref:Uncharacterized protein n=1 Tax=Hymenobacter roseosalivarius DSM 11622 TaxID=645990 RepID=A0A1W1VJX6_9BACT|nr:hypothetical protein SAMN00120144_2679 [Hymenobacter roseosalivarius DSM 11622]